MKFRLILSLFILNLLFTQAQQYSEVNPPDNIKTVQLFNPQTNDQTPVIRVGEYLILSFDDLNRGFSEYNYKIEHYNADWTPSGIFQSEFMDGFSSNVIRNFKHSFNTYVNYTHYQLFLPNPEIRFKLPGNYVVKIFTNDPDNPVFTRRFAVYDDRDVAVWVEAVRILGQGEFNQRINAVVSSGTVDLTQTPDASKLFVMKNGNWEDHLIIKKPQFLNPSQLTYNDMNHTFEGGSEYLWFDTKNLEVAGMTTEKIFRQDSIFNVVLRAESPRWNIGYFDDQDVNGAFYIRNIRIPDPNLANSEADYAWVHFALDQFDDEGGNKELYVVGAFNDWQLAPEYQLKLGESKYWEVAVLLKQGFYNYQFAVFDKSTNKTSYSEINGSFWQTENTYQALFYFRPWGVRFDMLIGYSVFNNRQP